MKKLIAAATTVGLLIVGTAGLAGATPSDTAPAQVQAHRGRLAQLGQVAAKTIGIEPSALRDAVKGGQSVADVAKSHNVEPQAVIDAIVAAVNTRVDAAVATGKIDAERGATIKEKASGRVTKLVNGDFKGKGKRARLRRHARRAGAAVAARTIGIDTSALRDAVKGGQSIAEVAKSHNVEPQAVIDAVLSAANTRIDQAVAADKITAERATKLEARLAERVTKLVNATPGARG